MRSIPSRILLAILVAGLLAAAPAAADFQQAMSNFKSGKYVEAAADFQALVDGSPNYASGYYMLGLSFLQMGKASDAEGNFVKAIELDGDRFEYHHGLARSYFDRKQYSKTVGALRTAEPLAADDKTKFLLYSMRGFSYAGLEKWGETVEDLEKAKKLRSTPAVLDRLGTAYSSLGHNDKAIPVMRESLKSNPGHTSTLTRLAAALIDAGAEEKNAAQKDRLYKEALQHAESLQRKKTADPDANNLVGRAALGSKNFPRAEQAFLRVIESDPNQCYAMVNLGKVYIGQQNWVEGEKILKRASQCAPKMALIYENLGFVVEKQKRLDNAIGYYEKAQSIKPSSGVSTAIARCQENIEIAGHNKDMDAEAVRQKKEEADAKAAYEAEIAKQKEWEKKRRKD